ncbi:MAG: hypothetical protein WDN28_25400 [Chthoniobacter sp.]
MKPFNPSTDAKQPQNAPTAKVPSSPREPAANQPLTKDQAAEQMRIRAEQEPPRPTEKRRELQPAEAGGYPRAAEAKDRAPGIPQGKGGATARVQRERPSSATTLPSLGKDRPPQPERKPEPERQPQVEQQSKQPTVPQRPGNGQKPKSSKDSKDDKDKDKNGN